VPIIQPTHFAALRSVNANAEEVLPQFELFGAQQVNIVVVAIGILVGALFFGSAASFAKERTGWRLVQLFGSFCWVVVVLAHIAEAFQLLPGMGWGLPNSPGHYLDLFSAIIGLILLPLGYVLARRRNSN
jgi:ABC-type glycerol-3-phosphate transport system permease component